MGKFSQDALRDVRPIEHPGITSRKAVGLIPDIKDPTPKGKNFSANNLGQRKASDFYETPYSMTRQLLDALRQEDPEFSMRGKHPFGLILEPACGRGAICKVLIEHGYSVSSFDLSDGRDFLTYSGGADTIITNPPFSLAQEFILKARTMGVEAYFLLPLSYLHGKKRFDKIYDLKGWREGEVARAWSLQRVFVFTRYPMLGDPLQDDGCYRTGMIAYAWYHFGYHLPAREHPEIHWLDNDKFIIRKPK